MEFTVPQGGAVLARTPATLRALLLDLDSAWVTATEGPATWSPYDIVGHMLHAERVDWIPRAELILAQGVNRRFEPFDRLAQFRDSHGRPLAVLLDEFEAQRHSSLATLDGWMLRDEQLALQGEHPEFGLVTLRQLLATWVTHDLAHIGQIARVMAKQYRDEVGPWRAYLPILDR